MGFLSEGVLAYVVILCLNSVSNGVGVLDHSGLWGYSSAGRALESHSRGQGFDSPYLHQTSITRTHLLF